MSIQPLKVACGDSGDEQICQEVFWAREGGAGQRISVWGLVWELSSEHACSPWIYSFFVGMAGEGPLVESTRKMP